MKTFDFSLTIHIMLFKVIDICNMLMFKKLSTCILYMVYQFMAFFTELMIFRLFLVCSFFCSLQNAILVITYSRHYVPTLESQKMANRRQYTQAQS